MGIRVVDDRLKGESAAAINLIERMRRFMEVAGEGLRRSMEKDEEEVGVRIGCVVADAFLSCVCRDIAEEKKVKWVAIWTSHATGLATYMHTDELRRKIGAQEGCLEAYKDKTLYDYIMGFPPLPIDCLPREVVFPNLSIPFIDRMLHQMSHILPNAAAVAVNSVFALESAASDTLNSTFNDIFLAVGPFSLTLPVPTMAAAKDPQGCLPWLNTQALASVVYISFGTAHIPHDEEFLIRLGRGVGGGTSAFPMVASSEAPSVGSERVCGAGGEELRKGKVVAWAPQTLVLGHNAVGAHLMHCGWNSVMESIVSGVPLICRALPVAEQRVNERLVVDFWRVGVEVQGGKLTKAVVTRAVERILGEEEGTTVWERIREMKRLVEDSISIADPHGSSVRNLNKFINIIVTD